MITPKYLYSLCLLVFSIQLIASAEINQRPAPFRTIIMTDMTHDDGNSLIRYLYYSHMFETEAIIVTPQLPDFYYDSKGPWQKVSNILNAYEIEYPQLIKHHSDYPTPDTLSKVTHPGSGALPIIWLTNEKKFSGNIMGRQVESSWGDISFHDWIGEGNTPNGISKDSPGSDFLLSVFEKPDDRPIYVQMWGGPITFIQALYRYRQKHSAQSYAQLLSKLRIFGILLQDITFDYLIDLDAVQATGCGNLGSVESTFQGQRSIVGQLLYDSGHFWDYCCPGGGRQKPISEKEVNGFGPLSTLYDHGGEGDTPAFLYLISAHLGLNDPENPAHGSWGSLFRPMGSPFPPNYYTTCGLDLNHLLRWSDATTSSFLNRLNYSIKEPEHINHEPVIVLEDHTELIINIKADNGATIVLDATESFDPDNDDLHFKWYPYPEASSYKKEFSIKDSNKPKIQFNLPSDLNEQKIHIILEVSDSDTHPLTSYRRIIIQGSH